MGLFPLLVASRVDLRRGLYPGGLNTPAGLAAGSPSLPGSKYRDKQGQERLKSKHLGGI